MLLFLFIGIAVVSLLWEIYYKRAWIKGVDVQLRFDAAALYEGSQTKLYEIIENRKRLPVPVLEVGFHAKRELDFADTENASVSDYIYKRDVFSVLGYQRITREIAVTCRKRGHYNASDADLTTHSLLYRKTYSIGIETDAEIYVYARMTDVSDIMTLCEHMLGTLQCTKRLYEDPFAFRTIRAYTSDDPMKAINWKASAKTGELMVNTFDSVQSQKAMIYLDVADTGILKQEALVEESIAVAASLARKMQRLSLELGFAFNGANGVIMPLSNKRGALMELERMLADFDDKENISSFSELIEESKNVDVGRSLSSDTLLIFITKNLDEKLLSKIKERSGDCMACVICPVFRYDTQAAQRSEQMAEASQSGTFRIIIRKVDA